MPNIRGVGDQADNGVASLIRSDPFKISGPAILSFSGGRTSAYMLWRVLQAHGGCLPDGVVVCFANTGREMPATLDFVRDCGAAWDVAIHWLEYRWAPGAPSVVEVSHNSASRDGEPFEAMLRSKSMLPNPVSRFCTIELKIRTMRRFVRDQFRWKRWSNVVGLRADEPGRVERMIARNAQNKDPFTALAPLAVAGVEEFHVLQFWREQLFDLRLAGPWEGNCDGCFLKNRAALERMWLDHPARMQWWPAMEALPHGVGAGGTFRADREDYATMAATVRDQGRLSFDINETALPCHLAACGV